MFSTVSRSVPPTPSGSVTDRHGRYFALTAPKNEAAAWVLANRYTDCSNYLADDEDYGLPLRVEHKEQPHLRGAW